MTDRQLGPRERAIVKADQLKRRTCPWCHRPDQYLTDRGQCLDCFGQQLDRLQAQKRGAR